MPDAFGQLIVRDGLSVPDVVRDLHVGDAPRRFTGWVVIEGGNALARLVARLAGFPRPAGRAPFMLDIAPHPDGGHVWTRHFTQRMTRSRLRYDAQRGRAVESFGPLRIEMSLSARNGVLLIEVARLRLAGLPLPAILTPRSTSREYQSDGRFGFDIGASLPGLGLLIRYRGELSAESTDAMPT